MKRRPERAAPKFKSKSKAGSADPPSLRPQLSRKRLWLFRLAAVFLVPAIVLLLLEGVLRLTGFGYPTSFFLPRQLNGKKVYVPNNRFGWRFFGPELSRQAFPFVLPESRMPDTVRIFVFGESAAYGDPQPEFGLPRMLDALLTGRFPEKKFEVINVGMTGINSHTIREIARDCAPREGDIWVIYMGNNEVVGPFGAGTVFGARAPSLVFVRASLALKATRIGQLIEHGVARFRKTPASRREWGGMQMFLDQQIRENDPSLRVVRDSFQRNLEDIITQGRNHGAKIVLSTVACNLKDCAPFGSLHRPDLAPGGLAKWEKLTSDGLSAQTAGKFDDALALYHEAANLDDAYAALRFRQGECLLALGKDKEAFDEFGRTRDLDTLRFRCDSGLNTVIRKEAANFQSGGGGVLMADADGALAQHSEHGIPGAEFFYEHVHLNFDGNYLLALTIGEQIAKLLPQSTNSPSVSWPSREACARRLAWTDFERYEAASQMLNRLNDPPFTAQDNHSGQLRALQRQLEQLLPATQPQGLTQAVVRCRDALPLAPNDWVLHRELALLQQKLADYSGAAASWRRVTELLPHFVDGWEQLGTTLEQSGHREDALPAFQRALALEPDSPVVNTSLGQLYAQQGNYTQAIRRFEAVLRSKPYWQPAHFELGKALEATGRKEEAEAHFQQALQNRIHTPEAYTRMGQFCFERRWYDRAATNFIDALRISPADAANHVNLGVCFLELGRRAEARVQFAEALRLNPNLADAHARLGLELGRAGDDGAALEHFDQAVRLNPDVIEFRLNLAIALSKQQRTDEARKQFQEVLQRSPTNQVALKYLRSLP